MKFDYVSIEKRDGVAIVRFDRKANLNAFNEKLVVELTHAAHSFFDDLETHVVVLTGAPNAFSAGFDLKAVDSWPSETDDLKRRYRAYGGVRLCKAWEVDAADNHCGYREARGRCRRRHCARVRLARVSAGRLSVRTGGQDRLEPAMGSVAAAHHPRRACSRQAHHHHVRKNVGCTSARWGLVDELADTGRAVEKALEMAEVVLSMPQPTVRMIKEAVNATANALHGASAFADADQSQLTASSKSARGARESFRRK